MNVRRPTAGDRLPRDIAPENCQPGDMVRATYPETDGLLVSLTGTLSHRVDVYSSVRWVNREGKTVFTYQPGYHRNPRITLLSRAEYPQTVLSLFDSLTERIE